MKNIVIILFFITLTTIGIFFAKDMKSAPTITYFPIDYGTSFEYARTNFEFFDSGDGYYNVVWHVNSKTEIPMYIRQDVSLLFTNGELHGMRSKWRENTDTISFTEKTKGNTRAKWEAISFHYGEIHENADIRSIQSLSHEDLYLMKQDSRFISLHNQLENKNLKKNIDIETNKKLLAHWQDLIHYFHIDSNNYYLIPLTSLYSYQETPFPGMDQENTDRVMGQLWEGLYKNYIIPNINTTDKLESFVPLILFEKKGDILLVLFEINGQKEKLIQKIGD